VRAAWILGAALTLSPLVARAAPPDPADAGAAKVWASCVEHVPKGATRPRLVERFPERGLSGYAASLEVTVEHGKGETVLPEGFRVQGASDAAKALADAGFVIPEGDAGLAPSVVSEAGTSGAPKGAPADAMASAGASTKVTIPFLVLPKEPGRNAMRLPPIPIAVRRASGELVTVCTRAHPILVEDPIANEVDPKPRANPPARVQRERWVMAERVALGALGGALLTLFFAYLYLSYRRRPKPEPYVEPKLPWVLALEELAAIRSSTLLVDGQTDEYFDRVSNTIRKYLGGRYGFDGLESTTDELRALLKRVRPKVTELQRIGEFLAECDLVKFARMVPTESDCLAALVRGEEIVEKTMPSAPPTFPSATPSPPRSAS
jgi:hypothetical protein